MCVRVFVCEKGEQREKRARDVAEILVDLCGTKAPEAPVQQEQGQHAEPEAPVLQPEQPQHEARKSQRVRKPSQKAAETADLTKAYVPDRIEKATQFYPTLPWHFACLRAVFAPVFYGRILGDLCAGAQPSLRNEYEKFCPKLPVVLRDANYGAQRFDALEGPLPKLDVLITSFPYGKGHCTPLLLRLVKAYPVAFVKLQLCYDRCASSDRRDEVLMGGSLAWEIRLSPSKYPSFQKDNPAIESWFVFANTAGMVAELDRCVDAFFRELYLRDGSCVEYDFVSDIGESAIVSVRERTKTIKWDMRVKKAGCKS